MRLIFAAGALSLSLSLGLFGGPANAALFYADHFSYPHREPHDLGLDPGVDGPGANVSGDVWQAFSGQTFPAESITVVNGKAELLISGSEDATRPIPNEGTDSMTAGETWYYGARVTVNDQRATPATTAIVKEYFLLMKDTTTTNFRSRLYVDNPSTGTGGAGYRFAIGPSSGAGNAVDWGTDLAFGTTYLVMASYEYDTGAVKMWVNPLSQASTNVSAAGGAVFGTPLSELSLRQAFNNGGVPNGPSVPNTQILIDRAAI